MSIFQLLNGLTFAALLFVVASGFTLIFGLLRIVNLAHGALYLFGGYIGFTVAVKTGSFALGGIGAMAAIAAIGFVLDPPDLDPDTRETWRDLGQVAIGTLPEWACSLYGFPAPPPEALERVTVRQLVGVLDLSFESLPGVLEARQRIELRMRA